MSPVSAEPIVVCPLTFEREALRRAGVSCRLICIGPGEAGVERLSRMFPEQPAEPVILAGVAGAADSSMRSGSACVIEAVVAAEGGRWRPTWRGRNAQTAATIASSRDVLTNATMKQAFAKRTGAQLVDQESEAFARLAEGRRWQWGIVRGISDDLATSLPPDIHKWVTDDGRTRILRVLGSCALRPRQVGSLIALKRNSERAMAAVAQVLADALHEKQRAS